MARDQVIAYWVAKAFGTLVALAVFVWLTCPSDVSYVSYVSQ